MAIHSSILAWEIPWMEEANWLQFMGLQRVGHNWGRTCSKDDRYSKCFQWTGREEIAVSGQARVLDHFSLGLKCFIFVSSKNSILRGQDHFKKRIIMIWMIQNSHMKKTIEEIRYFGEGIRYQKWWIVI